MQESARLIQALQSPTAYPHPAGDLGLLETHISWVLLAGDFAYKIKKPVRMEFLDFSTLAQREFYCHEEMRLNRRLAPQLYLKVTPITGTPDAPRIGGDGPPIEFAVQMRRFPQEALLSNVLKRGLLRPEHIDFLAREMAQFHRSIPRAAAESPFGTPEQVWQNMHENLAELAGGEETRLAVAPLVAWAEAEFERLRPTFAARKAAGFVRECHGDMHLGNMLLLDAQVMIFDCIEFCDNLRWIDVASEVAFAVMDLEDRSRAELAHRLLNAYLEHTGDYQSLAVMQFYLAYRALVRAKVALIRARQDDTHANSRRTLLEECEGYIELAKRYAARTSPRLVITFGPSGTGKTTVTQPLLEKLGAVRLRSDLERKRMFGLAPLERPAGPRLEALYSSEATQKTYDQLAALARIALGGGFPVIVDATFLKRRYRETFRQLAHEMGVLFTLLEFHTDPATLRERVAQRAAAGNDASDASLLVLEQQLASLEPLAADEQSDAEGYAQKH